MLKPEVIAKYKDFAASLAAAFAAAGAKRPAAEYTAMAKLYGTRLAGGAA